MRPAASVGLSAPSPGAVTSLAHPRFAPPASHACCVPRGATSSRGPLLSRGGRVTCRHDTGTFWKLAGRPRAALPFCGGAVLCAPLSPPLCRPGRRPLVSDRACREEPQPTGGRETTSGACVCCLRVYRGERSAAAVTTSASHCRYVAATRAVCHGDLPAGAFVRRHNFQGELPAGFPSGRRLPIQTHVPETARREYSCRCCAQTDPTNRATCRIHTARADK